jgi:hypothetical protein
MTGSTVEAAGSGSETIFYQRFGETELVCYRPNFTIMIPENKVKCNNFMVQSYISKCQ